MIKTVSWAFICEKCFKVNPIDITLNSKQDIKRGPFVMKLKINQFCDRCNHMSKHFVTDKNIAIAVSAMNKMGYKTGYSCEGHGEFCLDKDDKLVVRKNTVSSIGDPYIFVIGKKPIDKALFEDLVAIGFKEWDIGQSGSFKILDIKKEKDVRKLLVSPVFCFHYGFKKVENKKKYLIKTCKTPEEANEKMEKYLRNINKKLNTVLNRHLEAYYEQAIQDLQEKKLSKETI